MILLSTIPQSNVLVGLGLNKKLLSMVNKASNATKSVFGGATGQPRTQVFRKPIKFM